MTNLLTELGEAMAAEPADRAARLTALWDRLDTVDHTSRCIAAHYIADAQDDVEAEVRWDETALAEAEHVSDADLQLVHPSLSVAGFMPSLHLNVADGYRRLGRFDDARDHLATCTEFDFALQNAVDPDYAATIRGARDTVAAKIASGDRS